jgi:hypothetical protein
MSSHVFAVSRWLFASPLGERERTEVRGSTLVLTSLNPHPTLSLERGEANIALTT